MCTGVASQGLAAEPQAPPPPPSQSASATAPAAQQNAVSPAAGSAPAKPAITVIGTKPELTPQDKELISRGYKLEMRHGEKYFCIREQVLGSRFETKQCDTAQSIEAHRLESQEAVRTIQNDRPQVGK
jgi:hypothetical protein